jgi:hypothetical protein
MLIKYLVIKNSKTEYIEEVRNRNRRNLNNNIFSKIILKKIVLIR